MSYDGNGNLLTETDFNGQSLSFEYDVNDRQVKKIYEDLSEEITTYDAVGNRLSASDARGVTTFEYDARDRLVSKTDPDGTVIAYSYDAEGNQAAQTLTLPGALPRTQVHTFDTLNRLATVTDPDGGVTAHAYDAVGNRVEDAYPNGTVSTYTFDVNNRLVRLETQDPSGALLQRFDYALDPTGRRARVTELDGRTVAYNYDDIYRLTEERITPSGGGVDIVNTYTYDPVGNRTFSVEDGVSTAYIYDQNDRLSTAGGLTYQYDDNGNQTQVTEDATVIDYGYDQNDRLVSAETSVSGTPTSTVTFGYDVDGNRVSKDNNGEVSGFVVDSNAELANVLAETDATGLLIVEYLHGDDLYRQVRGGAESHFHYDGLGSTRTLTDAIGALTDGYQYDAWGNLINQAGFTENEFLFTGEQFDAELGDYYLRARYYDPRQGRFRTQDSFSGFDTEPLTLQKYLYANADPANRRDPTGEFSSLSDIAVAATIAGVLAAATIQVQQIGSSQVGTGFPEDDPLPNPRNDGFLILAALTSYKANSILNRKARTRNDEEAKERLYHGTTSNRASKIVKKGFNPGPDGIIFFSEDLATATVFARLAPITPGQQPAQSFSVIQFDIPRSLMKKFGLDRRFVIGECRGVRFIDIMGGSGFERCLFGEWRRLGFNGALITRKIQTLRIRVP